VAEEAETETFVMFLFCLYCLRLYHS
jgi:hypothetical protein